MGIYPIGHCDTVGCHNPANRNYCNGDGRLHGDGAVHTLRNGKQLLCNECHAKDAEAWKRQKRIYAAAWRKASKTSAVKGLQDLLP